MLSSINTVGGHGFTVIQNCQLTEMFKALRVRSSTKVQTNGLRNEAKPGYLCASYIGLV